jgi:hypothetical protein
MDGRWRRGLRTVAPILAVCLLGALFATPNAFGQAAIDQYAPSSNPGGGVAGDVQGSTGGSKTKGTQTEGTEGTAGNGSVAAQTGSGGGNLPFTGYPLTTFVWFVLGALVTGVFLRVVAAQVKRRGARGAT